VRRKKLVRKLEDLARELLLFIQFLFDRKETSPSSFPLRRSSSWLSWLLPIPASHCLAFLNWVLNLKMVWVARMDLRDS